MDTVISHRCPSLALSPSLYKKKCGKLLTLKISFNASLKRSNFQAVWLCGCWERLESPWPCTHSHRYLIFVSSSFASLLDSHFFSSILSLWKLRTITHRCCVLVIVLDFFQLLLLYDLPVIQSVWNVSSNDEDIPLVDFVPMKFLNVFYYFFFCFYSCCYLLEVNNFFKLMWRKNYNLEGKKRKFLW